MEIRISNGWNLELEAPLDLVGAVSRMTEGSGSMAGTEAHGR